MPAELAVEHARHLENPFAPKAREAERRRARLNQQLMEVQEALRLAKPYVGFIDPDELDDEGDPEPWAETEQWYTVSRGLGGPGSSWFRMRRSHAQQDVDVITDAIQAFLNGVNVPWLLSFRTLFAKVIDLTGLDVT